MSPPKILKHPEHVDVMLYGVGQFYCIASGYYVNITWVRTGSNLPRTSEVATSGSKHNITSILKLNNIAGYHVGNYCCIAKNKAGNAFICATLKVKGMCCIVHHAQYILPLLITIELNQEIVESDCSIRVFDCT